jgi:ATP-binding cassette, sub-family E, member 1
MLTHFLFLMWQDTPEWEDVLTYFRGSELQNYFTRILEDSLKAVVKPQYVDRIAKEVKVHDALLSTGLPFSTMHSTVRKFL